MNTINAAINSLYSRPGLRSFLELHNLRMSRALGQNFFINRSMLDAMISQAEVPHQEPILEIGPGVGHLTWPLIERGSKVIAIEKDRTFVHLLAQLAEQAQYEDKLTIIHQDALKVDLAALIEQENISSAIGNLPYNVSVPILFHLAYCEPPISNIYITVQKEVGDRILADAGCKSYGRLSIVLNYIYQTEKVRILPPSVFYPQPKVESIFIRMKRNPSIDLDLAKLFVERLVQVGFSHRRKKLRNQLKGSIIQRRVLSQERIKQLEANYNLDDRAEHWDLQTWLRLAREIRSWEPDG